MSSTQQSNGLTQEYDVLAIVLPDSIPDSTLVPTSHYDYPNQLEGYWKQQTQQHQQKQQDLRKSQQSQRCQQRLEELSQKHTRRLEQLQQLYEVQRRQIELEQLILESSQGKTLEQKEQWLEQQRQNSTA
ncbi:hypothetical protein BX616_006700, partial [Lobosporangium transversale]